MNIHEPATLLTDYLLAGLGGYLAWRLQRHSSIRIPATYWWFRALIVLTMSAFVGGSYHGFAPNLPLFADELWWRCVLWIICLLGFTMGNALVCELIPTTKQSTWKRILIAKLVVASLMVIWLPQFIIAIVDYGLVMLAWAVASLCIRRAWSGWIFTAVALSATAAWVQQNNISISVHLNHNDIFHLIQALALIGFYRGAKLMSQDSSDESDRR